MIEQFTDKYKWLSNFAPYDNLLEYENISYATVEHFYVAMKTKDFDARKKIAATRNPGNVKRIGRQLVLRNDWDKIKENVMRHGLNHKFSKNNPRYRKLLIDTGDKHIQEGNYWGDTYWGVSLQSGKGQNKLGLMLMFIRNNINN